MSTASEMPYVEGVHLQRTDENVREIAALADLLGELPDLPHVPELPGRGVGAQMTGRGLAVVA